MICNETLVAAGEELAKGWEITKQSFELKGLHIPEVIYFLIEGAGHIRATRVAELNELAMAIGALEDDINRVARGAPRLMPHRTDMERVQERAALVELQKRVSGKGCAGSTTVIEALFPDIPVRKRTESEKAEIERWLAVRREAGLKIDPETAALGQDWGDDMDPYCVCDEWEHPEEFQQFSRQHWASAPGSDIWVHFSDLPDETVSAIRARVSRQKVSNAFALGALPTVEQKGGRI